MNLPNSFSGRTKFVIGGALALLIIAWIIAYEPVTRNLISQDALCNNCHLAWESDTEVGDEVAEHRF